MRMEMSEKISLVERVSRQMTRSQCVVLSAKLGHSSPLLEVDKPPFCLRDKAIEIKEIVGGQVNSAYVANVDGCRVVWRTISLNRQ